MDNPTLEQAVKALAHECNRATTWDHKGFSKYDVDFGHRMADLPVEKWTHGQAKGVYKMLKKYRKQLASMGIDYDHLRNPETDVTSALEVNPLALRHKNTYPLRREIAQLGGRWSGSAWLFESSDVRNQALALCESYQR